ncbi:MAG: tetratricopeptide repeat protein [Cyclobacteriaceae bacterium]|nr:tetratricopeptide repeat protein [Cyclobacteriaceae bacterium]
MKVIILILLAFIIDPGKIGKINSLKSEAKEAYKKGDFETAISKYRNLVDSLGVNEDEVRLNLANAYFQSNDTVNTAISYQPLTQSKTASIRSIAHQQLGVLSNRQNKYEEALASFKQALKADPTNEDARYNYEMVKKKLDEQKKKEEEQKKNDPNKDEKNKDQKDQNKDQKDQKQDQKDKQDKEKQDKESKDQKDQQEKEEKEKQEKESKEKKEKEDQKENKDKKETPPSVSDKLKQMEMSEEKAQMILEAMKNQEIQYLQQNKRKATKPKDKGKPDW